MRTGYIAAPTHFFEIDIPMEKTVALYEAVLDRLAVWFDFAFEAAPMKDIFHIARSDRCHQCMDRR